MLKRNPVQWVPETVEERDSRRARPAKVPVAVGD